ncbi:MAG: hypothetical protein GY777_26605 [Candidatus Brocadiaceae bacterium]|nr:hypothetical protein [Candidatus Brocadiaceae bacterium]
MDESKLERCLNSVGKRVFVECYHLFESFAQGKISKEESIEQLVSENVSNESGAKIRLGNAKKIFDCQMERIALMIVIRSKRTEASTLQTAKNIIDRL